MEHFCKENAQQFVSKLHWTDNTGQHTGEYWSIEQIKQLTSSMTFPDGVTDWDKYVAFNYMYSDIAGDTDDYTILLIAHHFYFADEDWHEDSNEVTKIYDIAIIANK